MSNIAELDLNLENLFQPSWAQGKTEGNRFEKFTGNEGVKPERRFNDKPGERRAPRRDGPSGGGGGERRGGPPRGGGAKFGDRNGGPRRDDFREDRREQPVAPAPLPELTVAFIPEEKGVEQLARYIERLHLDSSLGVVRGVFVAQSVKPQARVLAEARGFRVVEVDYDELRGMKPDELRLF